jgi:hypothetical protein
MQGGNSHLVVFAFCEVEFLLFALYGAEAYANQGRCRAYDFAG